MAEPRPAAGTRREGPPRKEIARLVAAVVFAVLFIAFIVDNSHSVPVGFVVFDAEPPLIWVLVVTAVFGAVIDRLLSLRSRRKRQ